MKKLVSIIAAVLITLTSYAQPYFQGTIVKDAAYATNKKIIFRINPTASITTSIAYIEFAIRYPTAMVTTFNVNNITPNTAVFPGLNIQRLADFVSGGFTYVKFVHNTATVASRNYLPNANGFDVFTITTSGAPTLIPLIEMASDVFDPNGDVVFGIANGAGVLIDPGAGNQLYGPGFNIVPPLHLLPLDNIVLPIKITSFAATKKDNDALLSWVVENETSSVIRYEIERSVDGIKFDKINTLSPYGRVNNIYNITDYNLVSIKNSGIIYYRIKQIDFSGEFVYSDIKNVRLSEKGTLISIFPNPVIDFTTVKIDVIEATDVNISLISADGKQLQTSTLKAAKGLNLKKVDMNNLPKGDYLLKVMSGTEVQTIKVVKL
jgi:Secretion system C-terminal sorting domain